MMGMVVAMPSDKSSSSLFEGLREENVYVHMDDEA